MALTHVTTIRNSLADLVVDAIDAGASAGALVIMTSGETELAVLPCSDPAFGAASSGTATASSITSDTNAVAGTAALFKFRDSDSNEVFRGTVTATGGGGDLELSSVSFGAGDTVSISSFSYSASA